MTFDSLPEATAWPMQSLRGFDRLAAVLPVGVLRATARARCLYANARACALLGVAAEEAGGLGWTRHVAAPEREEALATWMEAAARSEPFALSLRVGRAAGPDHAIMCRVSPVSGVDGAARAFVAVLEPGDAATRARVAEIVHEVRQPLAALLAYAAACRRMVAGGASGQAELLDVLSRIDREAMRASAILDRLGASACARRRRAGSANDVEAVVRSVEPLVSAEARAHGIRLVVDLPADVPQVQADPVAIGEVLLNLIRNAIQATAAGGGRKDVCVRAVADPPSFLRLCVRDHGPGVSAESERHLFRPFYTTKDGGMGMGLTICRSIVRAHGGRIGFRRHRGGGSTFWFTLPLHHDS